MPEPFANLLSDSFSLLKEETPEFYRSMCRTLAPHEVLIRVDREDVGLLFRRDRVVLREHTKDATIRIETTRPAIIRLLDAEETLVGAVWKDELLLQGDATHLLQFHDGLMAYLHGAVRAPSFPALAQRLRGRPRRMA